MDFKAQSFNKNSIIRILAFVVFDIIIAVISSSMGLLLRYDLNFSDIPIEYVYNVLHFFPLYILGTLVIFYLMRLYLVSWSVASIEEVFRIVAATMLVCAFQIVGMTFLFPVMPRSYYAISFIIQTALTGLFRFSYRIVRFVLSTKNSLSRVSGPAILIIGVGESGSGIIKELQTSSRAEGHIVCALDDSPVKKGRFVHGVKVEGGREMIGEAIHKYHPDRVIIAMPSADAHQRKEVLELCQFAGATDIKVVPGIYQIIDGTVSLSQLRDVDITDLLGRDPVKINNEEVFEMISGKTVLVTGGGGSIGSELCRQIAAHNPGHLIVFDIYENNAYDIQQELRIGYPALNLSVLIGSVRNTHRINSVMQEYKPDIVFHAAAHKHVPLMEESPNEAVKNNVMGTLKTVKAAAATGVKKFVLISTDKAVNPTNIMGATKRICEMIIQMMDRACPGTDFVAVRFGNVLGSNGSVIPLFKKQIAAGGPVTVTDKRIIRFFMTIPEAVSLVLQASRYANGGEIFVLDMGDPVKIDDMARNLIRLSGYKPDIDIKIEYTGLRPGEKLFEELLMDEEGLRDTPNKLIHIARPIEMDDEWFMSKLNELDDESKLDIDGIRALVHEVVPTYNYSHPQNGGGNC